MASTVKRGAGIRSTKGHSGGVRASLRPLGQAAVGLASALAATGALAQESSTARPRNEATPSAVQASPTPAPSGEGTQATPTGAENTFVLPTVQVQGEAEGYHTTETSLTRLPAPIVNTPQSITVVPETVIEEQRATTVAEALRNVSGITVQVGEGGRQGDSFILRGFSAQTDIIRDGVRDLGWYTRDTFNLGGVEVYFGPSSVLFGRGSTGGAVNLVTKTPGRRESFQEVLLSGGTQPSGRVELDINQVLNDKLQVRVNAMGQLHGVADRTGPERNRVGVAPAARLVLGEKTTLEMDYLYQREDNVPDYGHPFFNGSPVSTSIGVDRDVWYGVEGQDTERVDAHVATARLLQRFGGATVLTNTLRYGRVDRFARPVSPRTFLPANDPNPRTIGRQRFETETDNTSLINQTDLRGELETGFLKHTANVGLELAWEKRDQLRFNLNAVGLTTGPNLPADLYNPDPTPDLSASQRTFASSSDSQQYTVAAYASDQIQITQYLELLGSLRVDRFITDFTSVASTGVASDLGRADTLFNWRVGAVLHPLEKTSLYGMYGTSANPSAEVGTVTAATQTLEPEKNETFEFGAKADLFEDRLGLSGALFRVNKKNARVPNPDPAVPAQVLEGSQRVQGFNVGIAGTVLENWRVLANYTFMDSEILEHTNPFIVGQRLPSTPKHSISLWTTYGVTKDLNVGGGAVYQDVTIANNPTSATAALNKVPNFWRFDAFASYALKSVDLQLNVYNLTNALYYDSYYGSQATPAEGISATLTGRVRF